MIPQHPNIKTVEPLAEIERLHAEIIGAGRTVLDKAIRLGKLLTQQKAKLKHGEWSSWVESNLTFNAVTAWRYMRVHDNREKLKSLTVKDLTEAYQLLSPPRTAVEPSDEADVKQLQLKEICIDAGTRSRAGINEDVVSEYAECINAGDRFPAVVVFYDGAKYLLADGFHRFYAHQRAGKTEINTEIFKGDRLDAIKFSLGSNHDHGIRNTNADKKLIAELEASMKAAT